MRVVIVLQFRPVREPGGAPYLPGGAMLFHTSRLNSQCPSGSLCQICLAAGLHSARFIIHRTPGMGGFVGSGPV